jgi:hypothetical protein
LWADGADRREFSPERLRGGIKAMAAKKAKKAAPKKKAAKKK